MADNAKFKEKEGERGGFWKRDLDHMCLHSIIISSSKEK